MTAELKLSPLATAMKTTIGDVEFVNYAALPTPIRAVSAKTLIHKAARSAFPKAVEICGQYWWSKIEVDDWLLAKFKSQH